MTPLMRQFWEIKGQHSDKILLFRMGDFYEMFYDDAKVAAPILNIALTSRNKKSEDDTPMCGVPHHSIATPISKLLAAGHRVAICDQLENPEEAKGIVKRGVTRILSPGMVYDPDTIDYHSANFVAAFDDQFVSFMDSSTGECFFIRAQSQTPNAFAEILLKYRPVEILRKRREEHEGDWRGDGRDGRSRSYGNAICDSDAISNRENEVLNIVQTELRLFVTEFSTVENEWPSRYQNLPESAARLLTYAKNMQGPDALKILAPFLERPLEKTVKLGAHVLKHLEVIKSYKNEDKGSLFYAINRTKSSAGARKLKSWLQSPLVEVSAIEERLNQVEFWTQKPSDLKILRQTLAQMGDIERRLTKISYTNCQPHDLYSLMQSLQVGLAITPLCRGVQNAAKAATVEIAEEIERVIAEDPPNNTKNGGFIKKGVDVSLDELIQLSEDGQKLLQDLETSERDKFQIPSLKIRFNNVFGYYIEVTNTHKDKVPNHYIRKQTLANAERYVTPELQDLEARIISSKEKRQQIELSIYNNLRVTILDSGSQLLEMASKWSELDVLSSLAWVAIEQNYTRPKFKSDFSFNVKSLRHPVVEQEVKRSFVPNDVSLNSGECLLLTGPNMAGKSTYMRQVALVSIMAQVGSFVPAKSADLPLVQQIYTRIGASDSLSEGLSTFMVEMRETAEMLKNASPNTLVILDEVGRGTSTYDGMSLAQSILEYLVTTAKSLTLFATHYHEITRLAEDHNKIHNAHMAVRENSGDIHFLYTLKGGPANKSYGIHVARLAGVPDSILARAQDLLSEHELKYSPSKTRAPSVQPKNQYEPKGQYEKTMERSNSEDLISENLPLMQFASESHQLNN